MLSTVLLVLAASAVPDAAELQQRREAAMRRLPDGILLVQARPGAKRIDEGQFRQDRAFYYLTGLADTAGALLAVDAPRRQSWLFVPPQGRFARAALAPGETSAAALRVEHVVAWDQLQGYLEGRLAERPAPVLYVDEGGFTAMTEGLDGGGAPGLDPVSNRWLLLRRSLEKRFPGASVRSAAEALVELRSIKSASEQEALRQVGAASASALRAGLRSLAPGRRQRESEAAVVSECLRLGEGPSFWPWTMTGPNATFPAVFEAFADYRHLDRVMHDGELARMDVGCALLHYEGDVGRTVPVSGRFDAGQRETWELLVAAYRAGLSRIRDGAAAADVIAASLREVEALRPSLATALGRKAAEGLLAKGGASFWQIHGVGLDSAEGQPPVLRAGMVVAYEPIFAVDGQGFYLEDMILVTPSGSEVLTPGLPYTAGEVEAAMRPAGAQPR